VQARATAAAPDATGDVRHTAGRIGEQEAVAWLERHGFRVLARNLRTRQAEIDVLARRGRTWIAVEVKARRFHPAPERCVGRQQHERLVAALRALAPSLRPSPRHLRIDVLAVRTAGDTAEVRHFPGEAFAP
jgi:putative endonuclease